MTYEYNTNTQFVCVPKFLYYMIDMITDCIGEEEASRLITSVINGTYDISQFTKANGDEPVDPNYVTGITDAEGNFNINIVTNSSGQVRCQFEFKVSQHCESAGMLYDLQQFDLQQFFGVNSTYNNSLE